MSSGDTVPVPSEKALDGPFAPNSSTPQPLTLDEKRQITPSKLEALSDEPNQTKRSAAA